MVSLNRDNQKNNTCIQKQDNRLYIVKIILPIALSKSFNFMTVVECNKICLGLCCLLPGAVLRGAWGINQKSEVWLLNYPQIKFLVSVTGHLG